jgi:type I restriction enzyme R subunit
MTPISPPCSAISQYITLQESPYAPGAASGKLFDISNIDFDRLSSEFKKFSRKNSAVQSLKQRIEQKLKRMVRQNPQRLDLYERYQQIIHEYNKETDRVTIEQTFEALLKLVESLSQEEQRAVREGLTEEYLAAFDLLCKGKANLSPRARHRVKEVARELVEAIKARIGAMENWTGKETTQATIQSFIYDYLWDDATGLPEDTYQPDEIEPLSEALFRHVYHQYPNLTESVYRVDEGEKLDT